MAGLSVSYTPMRMKRNLPKVLNYENVTISFTRCMNLSSNIIFKSDHIKKVEILYARSALSIRYFARFCTFLKSDSGKKGSSPGLKISNNFFSSIPDCF